MNINTNCQHTPSIHRTNGKDQIMGQRLSCNPMRATNISSHLKKENIHKLIGNFLVYAISVDPAMLVAVGTLAVAQLKRTEYTKEAEVHLLDY